MPPTVGSNSDLLNSETLDKQQEAIWLKCTRTNSDILNISGRLKTVTFKYGEMLLLLYLPVILNHVPCSGCGEEVEAQHCVELGMGYGIHFLSSKVPQSTTC